MVLSSEIVATASVSFLLGWALKNSRFVEILKRKSRFPSEDVKLAIVVRTDLKMSKGKIASQCSHAALACYRQGLIICPNVIKQWESQGETKVILRTDSGEESLREVGKRAANAGIVAAIIRDAGHTEVPKSTPTVLGIGPECSSKINKITSSLKLL